MAGIHPRRSGQAQRDPESIAVVPDKRSAIRNPSSPLISVKKDQDGPRVEPGVTVLWVMPGASNGSAIRDSRMTMRIIKNARLNRAFLHLPKSM